MPERPETAVAQRPAPGHVVEHEVPEDGHAHLEGDREGDVVEDAEARRHRGELALGEVARALERVVGLRELLFFEAGEDLS
jgi:hypothetical protein